MPRRTRPPEEYGQIIELIRRRIEAGGEKLWRLEDFHDLPFGTVALALSRLARRGILERNSKGIDYHARSTAFGKGIPSPGEVSKVSSSRRSVFPAGIAAANLLGFATQTARRSEVATCVLGLTRNLIGRDAVVHTRRPETWAGLSSTDATLLNFLRRAVRTRELSPAETVKRSLNSYSKRDDSNALPRSRTLSRSASAPSSTHSPLPAAGKQGRHADHEALPTPRLRASHHSWRRTFCQSRSDRPSLGRTTTSSKRCASSHRRQTARQNHFQGRDQIGASSRSWGYAVLMPYVGKFGRVLRRAVVTGAGLLIGLTALSFVPSNEWWIRVLDFPRNQIAVGLVLMLGASILVLHRGWRQSVLFAATAIALIAQLTLIVPYTRLVEPEVAMAQVCADGTRLRMLIANVEYSNRDSRDLIAMLASVEPDVVLLTETGAWWEAQLVPLERNLPHVVRQPQEDPWGMLLYSRFPLLQQQVRFLVENDIPSISAQIQLPSGDRVQFYGVHPRPPRPGDDTGERDTELMRVAREIRAQSWPAILAGDLNDVAWSRTSRRLQQSAQLLDPRVGRGLFPTFSANVPAGFRWPLDHVFVTGDFSLCSIKRLDEIGSDHFPILVETVLRREGLNQ